MIDDEAAAMPRQRVMPVSVIIDDRCQGYSV
jgi:hypothetical protein